MDNEENYNENVNYDELEQHTYPETPGVIFYTCPKCGKEFPDAFITEEAGEAMCLDCWSERYGN